MRYGCGDASRWRGDVAGAGVSTQAMPAGRASTVHASAGVGFTRVHEAAWDLREQGIMIKCDMCGEKFGGFVMRGKYLCHDCHGMINHLIDELLDPTSELWIRLAGLDPDEVGKRMEQAAREALARVGERVEA